MPLRVLHYLHSAAAGLSRVQLASLSAGGGGCSDSNAAAGLAAEDGGGIRAAGPDAGDHMTTNSVLQSLPVIVLADTSPSRPQAGIVLSVSPLLGAAPRTDEAVPKWLHVHVRPSVRGLLRTIRVRAAHPALLAAA